MGWAYFLLISTFAILNRLMKVCYWNVCNETSPEDIAAHCSDMPGVDVFCLQEVPYAQHGYTRLPATRLLARELGMDGVFQHTRTLRRSPGKYKAYGTAILSKSTIIGSRTAVLRDDIFAYMTPGAQNQRIALSAATEAEPGVTVAVAHLSYRLPLGLGSAGLLEERRVLQRQLSTMRDTSEVIFGGDMNAESGGGLDAMIGELGLSRVPTDGATFRSRHWFAGHATRELDRAFVTQGLVATAELGAFGASDHRPVIVDVHTR